ncbi:MAG: hypothetical protein AAF542_21025 [Pseudomonadota bacterium]
MDKVLLKTTVEETNNDWCVHRFQLLKDELEKAGFSVDCRNRINEENGNDKDFMSLPNSSYSQMWLFAIEANHGGLTKTDTVNIDVFRRNGKGLMLTRDHMDVGSTLVGIPEVGPAHHFHSVNPEIDRDRRRRDDTYSMHLDWPNYHSGLNGSCQQIVVTNREHPLLKRDNKSIRYFPAHPHEGAVSIPQGTEDFASVIAKGRSALSGVEFNLIIAFESHLVGDDPTQQYGRTAMHSSFHHFADYNWDTSTGCPSFVSDPEGSGMSESTEAQQDIRIYCRNLAHWLSDGSVRSIEGAIK